MIGQQQIAIVALVIGSFAAGYGVSFLRFDGPDEAYVNYMRQCVFLGDREDQCAEEWRLMDTEKDFSIAKLDGERKPNLSERDVKKKSVQRLSAKHGQKRRIV